MAEDGNGNWGNFGGNEADGNDSEPSAVLNDTAEMSLSFASFAGDPNSTESAENVNAETGAADGTTDAPIDLDWGNTGGQEADWNLGSTNPTVGQKDGDDAFGGWDDGTANASNTGPAAQAEDAKQGSGYDWDFKEPHSDGFSFDSSDKVGAFEPSSVVAAPAPAPADAGNEQATSDEKPDSWFGSSNSPSQGLDSGGGQPDWAHAATGANGDASGSAPDAGKGHRPGDGVEQEHESDEDEDGDGEGEDKDDYGDGNNGDYDPGDEDEDEDAQEEEEEEEEDQQPVWVSGQAAEDEGDGDEDEDGDGDGDVGEDGWNQGSGGAGNANGDGDEAADGAGVGAWGAEAAGSNAASAPAAADPWTGVAVADGAGTADAWGGDAANEGDAGDDGWIPSADAGAADESAAWGLTGQEATKDDAAGADEGEGASASWAVSGGGDDSDDAVGDDHGDEDEGDDEEDEDEQVGGSDGDGEEEEEVDGEDDGDAETPESSPGWAAQGDDHEADDGGWQGAGLQEQDGRKKGGDSKGTGGSAAMLTTMEEEDDDADEEEDEEDDVMHMPAGRFGGRRRGAGSQQPDADKVKDGDDEEEEEDTKKGSEKKYASEEERSQESDGSDDSLSAMRAAALALRARRKRTRTKSDASAGGSTSDGAGKAELEAAATEDVEQPKSAPVQSEQATTAAAPVSSSALSSSSSSSAAAASSKKKPSGKTYTARQIATVERVREAAMNRGDGDESVARQHFERLLRNFRLSVEDAFAMGLGIGGAPDEEKAEEDKDLRGDAEEAPAASGATRDDASKPVLAAKEHDSKEDYQEAGASAPEAGPPGDAPAGSSLQPSMDQEEEDEEEEKDQEGDDETGAAEADDANDGVEPGTQAAAYRGEGAVTAKKQSQVRAGRKRGRDELETDSNRSAIVDPEAESSGLKPDASNSRAGTSADAGSKATDGNSGHEATPPKKKRRGGGGLTVQLQSTSEDGGAAAMQDEGDNGAGAVDGRGAGGDAADRTEQQDEPDDAFAAMDDDIDADADVDDGDDEDEDDDEEMGAHAGEWVPLPSASSIAASAAAWSVRVALGQQALLSRRPGDGSGAESLDEDDYETVGLHAGGKEGLLQAGERAAEQVLRRWEGRIRQAELGLRKGRRGFEQRMRRVLKQKSRVRASLPRRGRHANAAAAVFGDSLASPDRVMRARSLFSPAVGGSHSKGRATRSRTVVMGLYDINKEREYLRRRRKGRN